ncbi:hypothetical protein ZIOFF_023497 [Zingiber officinale]|uniref:Uncharacterized protein n=1 Tax=Zingiber officinale TaxID=94328 RepID=A0A8J5GQR1_ZINOF|nr:hypothetical protein ZIOFF_023497 [Zingiber officinale]
MSSSAAAAKGEWIGGRRQLDLFPLQPDRVDRDTPVASLLEDCGGDTNPTLAAVLGGGSGGTSSSSPSIRSR